mgnify:CR=1 FL=1
MRLKDILTEEDNTKTSLQNFLDSLRNETLYDEQQPLLRGMTNQPDYGKRGIRKDRQPRDSSLGDTMIFNELFRKIHGIDFIRSRGAFLTSSYRDAVYYTKDNKTPQNVYFTFPTKGSTFVYNPNISDSVDTLVVHQPLAVNRAFQNVSADPTKDTMQDALDRMGETFRENVEPIINSSLRDSEKIVQGYETSKFVPTFDRPTEVILLGDQYYFISITKVFDLLDLQFDTREIDYVYEKFITNWVENET